MTASKRALAGLAVVVLVVALWAGLQGGDEGPVHAPRSTAPATGPGQSAAVTAPAPSNAESPSGRLSPTFPRLPRPDGTERKRSADTGELEPVTESSGPVVQAEPSPLEALDEQTNEAVLDFIDSFEATEEDKATLRAIHWDFYERREALLDSLLDDPSVDPRQAIRELADRREERERSLLGDERLEEFLRGRQLANLDAIEAYDEAKTDRVAGP